MKKTKNTKASYVDFCNFYLLVLKYTRMVGTQRLGYAIAEQYWSADHGGGRAYPGYAAFRCAKNRFSKAPFNTVFYVVRISIPNVFDAIVEASTELEPLIDRYENINSGQVFIHKTRDGYLKSLDEISNIVWKS